MFLILILINICANSILILQFVAKQIIWKLSEKFRSTLRACGVPGVENVSDEEYIEKCADVSKNDARNDIGMVKKGIEDEMHAQNEKSDHTSISAIGIPWNIYRPDQLPWFRQSKPDKDEVAFVRGPKKEDGLLLTSADEAQKSSENPPDIQNIGGLALGRWTTKNRNKKN